MLQFIYKLICFFDNTAFSTIQYKEQIEYIKNASLDTLIIIFSATSNYFEYYDVRLLKKKIENMNIWFLGSGNKLNYIYHSISNTQSDQLSTHPAQLIYVTQLITQIYAYDIKCFFYYLNSNKHYFETIVEQLKNRWNICSS